MGQFGFAAIKAVRLIQSGKIKSPQEAWYLATQDVIKSPSSRYKGCPRDAFLGLCEEGLIKGVTPGYYTKSKKNKLYAVTAVEILKETPELAENKEALWLAVLNKLSEPYKNHNNQMDVVVSLWKNNLIKDP